jgi:hypothetical protein
MVKYVVFGQAFNRQTGKPVGKPRQETIDSNKNEIFAKATTVLEVKNAYESFWNEMNPHSSEIVMVKKIVVKH